nr:unnamed protein product [Callosobruchus analis]
MEICGIRFTIGKHKIAVLRKLQHFEAAVPRCMCKAQISDSSLHTVFRSKMAAVEAVVEWSGSFWLMSPTSVLITLTARGLPPPCNRLEFRMESLDRELHDWALYRPLRLKRLGSGMQIFLCMWKYLPSNDIHIVFKVFPVKISPRTGLVHANDLGHPIHRNVVVLPNAHLHVTAHGDTIEEGHVDEPFQLVPGQPDEVEVLPRGHRENLRHIRLEMNFKV